MLLTCRTIYKECRKTAFRNTVFHITTSLSVDESADRDSVVTYQSRVLRQGLSAHHESGLLSLVTHISISRGLHEAIFVAASLDSEVDSLATLLSQALPAVEYIFLDYTTPPAPRQDGPRPSSREGNWLERYSPSCQAIAGAVKIFPLLSQLVLLDHHRDEGRYGQNGLSNMLLTFGDFVERAFEPERISINECVDRMSICLEVRITSPSLMRKFGNIKHVHVHYAVIARLWERLDAPWINECPVDDGRRPADYRLMARDGMFIYNNITKFSKDISLCPPFSFG